MRCDIMQKKISDFLKKQKIITILLSVGIISIYVILNLIALSSSEFIPLAIYCFITIILLLGFILNICYYRFFCLASYSFSVRDGNVFFEKMRAEQSFQVSECKEIKFYSQFVKFKFPNETVYLINFISAKNVVFDSPQIDVKTAKQIFTNSIIQY